MRHLNRTALLYKHLPSTMSKRRRLSTTDSASSISRLIPHKARVLHEDDCVIAYDKPGNMPSVPTREMAVKVQGLGVVTSSGTEMPRPRSDQWIQAIEGAMTGHDGQPVGGVLSDLLQHLSSVPRREEQFKNYLRRVVKVEDEHLRSQTWDAVAAEDNRIRYPHGFIAGVPDDVLCAADVASEIAGRRVYVVHRLDMETSGVILFAKTSSACARLNEQFREKVVKKTYLAEVAGRWDGAVDRVDLMIRPDLDNRPRQIVDPVGGKECTTLVQVVRYNDNGDSSTNSSTILKLSPITGRTHQLRVHTSALGLPILGDSLYAPESVQGRAPEGLRLHAHAISFTHPETGESITLKSKCPFVEAVVV